MGLETARKISFEKEKFVKLSDILPEITAENHELAKQIKNYLLENAVFTSSLLKAHFSAETPTTPQYDAQESDASLTALLLIYSHFYGVPSLIEKLHQLQSVSLEEFDTTAANDPDQNPTQESNSQPVSNEKITQLKTELLIALLENKDKWFTLLQLKAQFPDDFKYSQDIDVATAIHLMSQTLNKYLADENLEIQTTIIRPGDGSSQTAKQVFFRITRKQTVEEEAQTATSDENNTKIRAVG